MILIDIGGGYSYAPMRVGMAICSPAGIYVYIQPGDATATMLENIAALDVLPADKRGAIADMILGDYFA